MGADVGTAGGARRPVVGYVSGVFDMFHIGHLNIVMRARTQCDWLVVGVVTDEVVQTAKGRAPVIPLAERLEIVRGLRDVDEVVADPWVDKFDTWQHLLRFDVLFKGDDWRGTPKGDALERRLRTVGARIEFFPYTDHTSSTLLREVLTRLAHTPVEPFVDETDGSGATRLAVARQGAAAAAVVDAADGGPGAGADDDVAARGACPTCGRPVPKDAGRDCSPAPPGRAASERVPLELM